MLRRLVLAACAIAAAVLIIIIVRFAAGKLSAARGPETGAESIAELNVTTERAMTENTAAGATAAAASAPENTGPSELETGRDYLRSLERRTPMEMEVLIDEARALFKEQQDLLAYSKKRESYRETLRGDALWSSFDDYVFLGDSRVVGFTVYNLLPEDRVLAQTGDTINAITDQLDQIRSMDPKYIFISYGINDIGIGFWPTAEEYAEAFGEKLDELHAALPDAEIYVNSILPATEEAAASTPVWAGLPEYSEAVSRMCEKKDICFIDNTSLVAEHEDLYAGDGVHLQPDFYHYWGENQLLGVFDHKNGRRTFSFPEQDR